MTEQTNFDMACDVFYDAIAESEIRFTDEDTNAVITPALKKFRDELKDQMGNEEYYVSHKELKNKK